MQTQFETLFVERDGDHILVVKLNRPEVHNALNTLMSTELYELFRSLYVDQGDIRCIVLTGSGKKAFCAGGDLKERNEMTNEAWLEQHRLFEQETMVMMDCPVPIIAAVNGVAFGGGCELALCADFIYAARSARFALPETTLGIMPGKGGTQNLPRACGARRAKEIIFTGDAFSSEEALSWGIVNKVSDDESILKEALATARKIAGNGPISLRQAKKSVNTATQADWKTGYAFEIEAYNHMVPTEDRLEGVRAFNEKRKPKFKGT